MEPAQGFYEGPLQKVSPGVLKSKTKVWVVLTQESLSLYRLEKRSSCIGSVETSDIQTVQCSNSDHTVFEVVGVIKSYKFIADSKEAASEWISRIEQYTKTGSRCGVGQSEQVISRADQRRDEFAKIRSSRGSDEISPGANVFGVRLKSTRKEPNLSPQPSTDISSMPSASKDTNFSRGTNIPDQRFKQPNAPLPVSVNKPPITEVEKRPRNVSSVSSAGKEEVISTPVQHGSGAPSSPPVSQRLGLEEVNWTSIENKQKQDGIPSTAQEEEKKFDKSRSDPFNDGAPWNETTPQAVETGENQTDTSEVILRRSRVNKSTHEIGEPSEDTVDMSEVQLRHTSRSSKLRSTRSLQSGSVQESVEQNTRDVEGDKDTIECNSEVQLRQSSRARNTRSGQNSSLDCEGSGFNISALQAANGRPEPDKKPNDRNGKQVDEKDDDTDELIESVFGDSKTTFAEIEREVVRDHHVIRSCAFDNLKLYLENNVDDGFCLERYTIKEKNAVNMLKDLLGM